MDNTDYQRLLHIIVYCEDITGFIKRFGKDYQVFIKDRAYFNAVAMCIMQIGELSNSLSGEFRKETRDQIPWHMIRGMRNWIAHAYLEVSEETIWDTAINKIPELLHFCINIVKQ